MLKRGRDAASRTETDIKSLALILSTGADRLSPDATTTNKFDSDLLTLISDGQKIQAATDGATSEGYCTAFGGKYK